MKDNEKRIVRKSYKNLTQTEIIRLGNCFVDDFLFEDNKAVDSPINALRAIFNILVLNSLFLIIFVSMVFLLK